MASKKGRKPKNKEIPNVTEPSITGYVPKYSSLPIYQLKPVSTQDIKEYYESLKLQKEEIAKKSTNEQVNQIPVIIRFFKDSTSRTPLKFYDVKTDSLVNYLTATITINDIINAINFFQKRTEFIILQKQYQIQSKHKYQRIWKVKKGILSGNISSFSKEYTIIKRLGRPLLISKLSELIKRYVDDNKNNIYPYSSIPIRMPNIKNRYFVRDIEKSMKSYTMPSKHGFKLTKSTLRNAKILAYGPNYKEIIENEYANIKQKYEKSKNGNW